MKEIAIYGFGGFGREVACLIRKINERQPRWKFIGYFDDGHAAGERNAYGEVLDEWSSLAYLSVIAMSVSYTHLTLPTKLEV